MIPETFQSLEHWWELRLDQKIEECHVELSRIKTGLRESQTAAPETEVTAELRLMEASLHRAEGQFERASREIDEVEKDLRAAGLRPHCQVYLQRGIQLLTRADYSGSLELFLAARSSAKTGLERAWALSNALFCLEYLGLPFAQTRADFEREAANIDLPRGIRDQVLAFDMRHAFRRGDLAIFSEPMADESGRLSQPYYYRLWLGSLPFLDIHGATSEQMERFICSDPWFHLRSYRARTLQGITHADDLESVKPTELADRLYLWTWRWLEKPEVFPFERVSPLLKLLDPKRLGGKLASEDFQMIRNCLLWFALFDGSSSRELAPVFAFMKPSQGGDYPIFDFERAMIALFESVRDGCDSDARRHLDYLCSHPVWNAEGVRFRSLIEEVLEMAAPSEPERLFALSARLAPQLIQWIRRPRSAPVGAARFDMVTYEIRKKGAAPVISPPMCKAFLLLSERKTVTAAELAQVCFGLHRFEPVIHDAKILNLLARMRSIAPREMRLGVKSGSVFAHAEPKTWALLHFERKHPLASALHDSEDWRIFLTRPLEGQKPLATDDRFMRPGLILRKMAGRGEISRLELEKMIGKSRATSHRLIARWLERGYLKKKGNARSTRYIIVKIGENS